MDWLFYGLFSKNAPGPQSWLCLSEECNLSESSHFHFSLQFELTNISWICLKIAQKSFILQQYEAWSTIKLDQISSQQFFDLRILFFYAWTSMNLELKKRLRISNPSKSFCNGQYLYETWLLLLQSQTMSRNAIKVTSATMPSSGHKLS